MKFHFEWQGLNFEDAIKGQKGEIKQVNLDVEMGADEMLELAKNDKDLIVGLLSIGKDYLIQRNKEKSEEGLKKMAMDAFEAIKPKTKPATTPKKVVDDGELY